MIKKDITKLRLLFVLLIVLVQFAAPVAVTYAQSPELLPSGLAASELPEKIDAFVDENRASLAGMATAVFDAEGVLLERQYGFADLASKSRVDQETVFEWGSVTKLLTWVSVIQLWEQGKLDLEADIRQYLPDGFLSKATGSNKIRLLDLMNHQAGFQEVVRNLFSTDPSSIRELEVTLRESEPIQIYKVGEVTSYSNWGAALAALIVERVAGMSFVEYVHANIFEPLGMEQTAIWMDLSDNPWVQAKRPATSCYTAKLDQATGCFFYIPMYPAGMATGTLGDFLLFAQALNPKGQSWQRLFAQQATVDFIYQPTSFFPDHGLPRNAHGFWANYYGVLTFGHGGNTAGQSANLLVDPKSGVGMVVMTNQASEQLFTGKMPELVFGKFSEAAYNISEREIPKTLFRTSRTFEVGPFSLIKNLNLMTMEASDQDSFWEVGQAQGRSVLRLTYFDLFSLDTVDALITYILLLSVIFGGLYALVALIVALIRKLRRTKPTGDLSAVSAVDGGLPRWRNGSLLLVLLLLIAVIALAYCALSFVGVLYFYILIAVFWILFVLILWQLLKLPPKIKGLKPARKELRSTLLVVYLLIAGICSIVYFQLYQFWNL